MYCTGTATFAHVRAGDIMHEVNDARLTFRSHTRHSIQIYRCFRHDSWSRHAGSASMFADGEFRILVMQEFFEFSFWNATASQIMAAMLYEADLSWISNYAVKIERIAAISLFCTGALRFCLSDLSK